MHSSIHLEAKFQKITEYWTPKIIGELNGQYVKLAKVKGEFVWHHHAEEDELFHVIRGTLYVDFRDHTTTVKDGELIIVPRGVEHRPRTEDDEEVWLLLFEPKATKHTGEVQDERTVEDLEWI